MQVALFGPYAVNVIVPVGLTPPDSVPVSLIVPPAGTVAEATVVIAGAAFVTVTDSPGAPQPETAAALFASPL